MECCYGYYCKQGWYPFLRMLALLSIMAIQTCPAWAQESIPDSIWNNASKIKYYKTLTQKIQFVTVPRKELRRKEIEKLPFACIDWKQVYPNLPLHYMDKTIFLRFALYNNADHAESVYLSPGFYFRDLVVYRADRQGQILDRLPDSQLSKLYPGNALLELSPGDSAVFIAGMKFIRTNTNSLYPYLVEKEYMRDFMQARKHRNSLLDTITFVISGILLMMIFYSLAVYIQSRNREFIYYSIYAFCSATLVFYKSFLISDNTALNFFYEEYLDFMIMGLGVFFYLIFVRHFLDTRRLYPFLEKWLIMANLILISLLSIFSLIYFFSNVYMPLFIMENYIIKIFLFVIGIVFVVYGFRKRSPLLHYLVAGNLALIFFSILSLMVVLGFQFNHSYAGSIWNKGMLYYELGLVFELLFFLSGLAYKNRHELIERVAERERLKLENERKEFEKQMAVLSAKQEERDRISADMHDELGSGMTAIRLMSEIAKAKMKNEYFPELERISQSANDLLGKMNTIIWTMKSSNDSLESLIAYLREHSLEYFENTSILCSVSIPDSLPSVEMSGEKRRNIFLSVKESLHNIIKHAQAGEVKINIFISNQELHIIVADNGRGIDTEKLRRFGNGLSNMKRRMESIQGQLQIDSSAGTRIEFIAPL